MRQLDERRETILPQDEKNKKNEGFLTSFGMTT